MQTLHLHYQLTAEDYEEANHGHFRINLWLLLVACSLLLLPPLVSEIISPQPVLPRDAPPPPRRGFLLDVVLPLASWACFLVIMWVYLARSLRVVTYAPWRRRQKLWAGPRPYLTWLAGAAAFTCVVVLTALAIRAKRAATAAAGITDPDVSPAFLVIFQMVPFLLSIGAVAFLFRKFPLLYRRAWEAQTILHRPFVAEIDERSLRVSEPLASYDLKWDYFPGWIETPGLFVVYSTAVTLHLLPKRAFADEGQVEWFRALLARVVSERPAGFPVVASPATQAIPPRQAPPPLSAP